MSELRPNSWVEVSASALAHNITTLKSLVSDNVIFAPVVKSNAWGYGLVECSQIFLDAGADWLCVNALYEAEILRDAGITAPIYVMGYIALENLEKVIELDVRMIVYNKETIDRLGELSKKHGKDVHLHLKLETGTNRQGLKKPELLKLAQHIQTFPHLRIEGLCTHLANIEDTKDLDFTNSQIQKLHEAHELLVDDGIEVKICHVANSAATLLLPETHLDMVRVGIACYGMWPSEKVKNSYKENKFREIELHSAFTWKTVVAQVKQAEAGEFVSYGCTVELDRDTQIAVLPVGYYEGYDRHASNRGEVLIHGQRAKILGRVAMNMMMVDVTDIDDVKLEDEVVLIGRQGEDEITPEEFADWADTINYEITTRVTAQVNTNIPRIVVE